MAKLFKKKEIFKVKSLPIDPSSIADPVSADEFQQRGMAYYARKQFEPAESDLKKAIGLDSNHIDSYYSLGMVYKASKQTDEGITAFRKVIELIKANSETSSVRFDMLRRLALGHINEMSQGDWNLEKEIWKHIP